MEAGLRLVRRLFATAGRSRGREGVAYGAHLGSQLSERVAGEADGPTIAALKRTHGLEERDPKRLRGVRRSLSLPEEHGELRLVASTSVFKDEKCFVCSLLLVKKLTRHCLLSAWSVRQERQGNCCFQQSQMRASSACSARCQGCRKAHFRTRTSSRSAARLLWDIQRKIRFPFFCPLVPRLDLLSSSLLSSCAVLAFLPLREHPVALVSQQFRDRLPTSSPSSMKSVTGCPPTCPPHRPSPRSLRFLSSPSSLGEIYPMCTCRSVSSFLESPTYLPGASSPALFRQLQAATFLGKQLFSTLFFATDAASGASRVGKQHVSPATSEKANFFSLENDGRPRRRVEVQGEEDEEERRLLWRTTNRRLIDFRLSPEAEERLGKIHEAIMQSPLTRPPLSEELASCLHSQADMPASGWRRKAQALADCFFYGDTLRQRGRRLLSGMMHLYTAHGLLREQFGIAEDDFCGHIYFLLLHVWLVHRRLVAIGDEMTRASLWEALEEFFKAVLSEEKVSEMRISAYVREMQNTALGFCLSLDEAFDGQNFAGEAAHRIWFVIFRANKELQYSSEVLNLTAYLVRTVRVQATIAPLS
ncbi:ubiquinol-cytochrome c family chaperone [Cystoisospora suis]|uniref:Ubiquinol-cytochrome c family chaperone n=1 Tax=Cystoisospora suis TaxID=483139 RepID=A0A2C6KUL7_9APIC|nr:ubiquinol-cytochrome c family chaperone [Cystoisospora suis]